MKQLPVYSFCKTYYTKICRLSALYAYIVETDTEHNMHSWEVKLFWILCIVQACFALIVLISAQFNVKIFVLKKQKQPHKNYIELYGAEFNKGNYGYEGKDKYAKYVNENSEL